MHPQVGVYGEKLAQVPGLLREHELDAWLIFVRETSMGGEPALRLIAPLSRVTGAYPR